ncbi:formylglycine-generating enzyme required for sulfatase activity [Sphingomonas sp. PvP055]|uniref:SUMF1/EgtB/PvdO family nonheme iron enzyme n=1 Tax=Sphingomonas sp. PvP055 TaxID=3156391 RepID=UPI003390D6B0
MIRALLLALGAVLLVRADAQPAPATAALARCGGDRDGGVTVPASRFLLGSDHFYPEEGPPVPVEVAAFDLDRHEVTNRQFAAFVAATGYVTQAERPGGGAFVFKPPTNPVETPNPAQWWRFVKGADWRHPHGPATDLAGRAELPVVDVSYADAAAYAHWAGRALPSEEQFEAAARAGLRDPDARPDTRHANTWQGRFPDTNSGEDGYVGPAPVGCFEPNVLGAHDLIGNVWEWTKSWYVPGHGAFVTGDGTPGNPSYDPRQPGARARVIKGGSFLCASNYCARYRPAARHAQEETLAASHLGFRTISAVQQRAQRVPDL